MPKKTQPAPRYRHRETRKSYVLIHEKDGDYLEGIDRHRLPITQEKLTTSNTWERLP
jgi:hypothetical protein